MSCDDKRVRTSVSPQSKQKSRTDVSVIVPTYNESENIVPLVNRCLRALPVSSYDAEVIIVDDDSDDYTWQFPRRLFGDDPRVRVIRRQAETKGLALSVVEGIERARFDYCAVIDADLQHPPEKLPELFDALDGGADVAIGSRHVEGGGIENWPMWRKAVSRGATVCARAALPDARDISDPMSGFFAVRRQVIEGVSLDPQGYKILLEILAKGQYETIAEVPFIFRERERGESNLTADEYKRFLEHLGQLAVVARGFDAIVDPSRAVRAAEFSLVGAIGAVVNMAVFAAATLVAGVFYLAAGIAAFLVAVNWNFAGNWLLTFDRPQTNVLRQYVRFHLVSITGFLAYSATLTVTIVSGIPPLAANATAIVAGAGFNFIGSDTVVFPTDSEPETTSESDETSELPANTT